MAASESWKKALDENMAFIVENLILTEGFHARLIQHDVLTTDFVELVKAKETQKAMISELVGLVKKRSVSNFLSFLDALYQTGNGPCRDALTRSLENYEAGTLSTRKVAVKSSIDKKGHPSHLGIVESLREELDKKNMAMFALENDFKDLQTKYTNILAYCEELEEEMMLLVNHRKEKENRRNRGIGVAGADQDGRKPEQNEPLAGEDKRTALVEGVRDLEVQQAEKELTMIKKEHAEKENELKKVKKELAENESELTKVKTELDQTRKELKDLQIREQELKVQLGLTTDATQEETLERLKTIDKNETALVKVKEELERIHQENVRLIENDKTLTRRVYYLDVSVRTARLQMKRIMRKDPSMTPTYQNKMVGLHQHETKFAEKLPRHRRFSENEPPRLSKINITLERNNLASGPSRETKALPVRFNSETERRDTDVEAKFCLLCRKEYYVREECVIHIKPIKSGKYTCCNTDANDMKGCRVLRHMYVMFTGVHNEYYVYDEYGRHLAFNN